EHDECECEYERHAQICAPGRTRSRAARRSAAYPTRTASLASICEMHSAPPIRCAHSGMPSRLPRQPGIDFANAAHQRERLTNSLRDHALHGTAGCREGVDHHNGVAIAPEIVNQTECNYVQADLRIYHHAECVPGRRKGIVRGGHEVRSWMSVESLSRPGSGDVTVVTASLAAND